MSDPTVPILSAAFGAAIGIFIAAAVVRGIKARKSPPAEAESPPYFPNPADPYSIAPAPAVVPPPLAPGIPIWPYRKLDLIFAGLIIFVFGSLGLATASADSSEIEYTSSALVTSIIFQLMMAALAIGFVFWRIHPSAWLGLRWRNWTLQNRLLWLFLATPIITGLLLGGMVVLHALNYMQWMESLGVEPIQDSVKVLQQSKDTVILVLMSVAAVIVAPVCEEIIFRGYLFGVAKKFAGTGIAVVCSGIIFAAAHGNLTALLPLTFVGMALAVVYDHTKSIWAPIAVHFCFNGFTVVVQMIGRAYPHLIQQQ
jgi:membrane protease YdiL (CAAX protease family)